MKPTCSKLPNKSINKHSGSSNGGVAQHSNHEMMFN